MFDAGKVGVGHFSRSIVMPRSRKLISRFGPVFLAAVFGAAIGASFLGGTRWSQAGQKDDHRVAVLDVGAKAPLAEVMHCPLAFTCSRIYLNIPPQPITSASR